MVGVAAFPPEEMAVLGKYGNTKRGAGGYFALPDGREVWAPTDGSPRVPEGVIHSAQLIRADDPFTQAFDGWQELKERADAEEKELLRRAHVLCVSALFLDDVLNYLGLADVMQRSLRLAVAVFSSGRVPNAPGSDGYAFAAVAGVDEGCGNLEPPDPTDSSPSAISRFSRSSEHIFECHPKGLGSRPS